MKRWREEGQNLALLALAMVPMLAMLALIIDVGLLVSRQRLIQNAADAGALAGAWELSQNGTDSDVYNRIHEYTVVRNSATTFTATYQPSGTPVGSGSIPSGTEGVTVVAEITFPTVFAGILGIETFTVDADATAKLRPACGGGFSLWANNQSDNLAIHFSGSNVTVNGGVHSNAGIHSTGVNLRVYGLLRYATNWQRNGSNLWVGNPPYDFTQPPGCGCNLWIGNPAPQQAGPFEMPVQYNIEDYAPGGSIAQAAQNAGKYHYWSGNWKVSGQNYHVPSGLHFVEGKVKFSGSNIFFDQGPVTIVVRGTFITSGSNLAGTWQPYTGGLSLFSNSAASNAVKTAGTNGGFYGIVYVPKGRLDYSGSNTITGSIFADRIKFTGSNATVNFDSQYCPDTGGVYLSE
jgi:hypothetical protein